MRYTFNMVTMMKEKVNTHFSFPLRLDMTPYTEDFLMGKSDRKEGNFPSLFLAYGSCKFLKQVSHKVVINSTFKNIKLNLKKKNVFKDNVTHSLNHQIFSIS